MRTTPTGITTPHRPARRIRWLADAQIPIVSLDRRTLLKTMGAAALLGAVPAAGRGGRAGRRSDLSGHVPRHARRRTRPAAHLPRRAGHRRRGADPAPEADRRVARPDGRAGGAVEGRRAQGPPGSLQGRRHRDHQHDDRRLQRRDLGRAEGRGADRQRRRVDQGGRASSGCRSSNTTSTRTASPRATSSRKAAPAPATPPTTTRCRRTCRRATASARTRGRSSSNVPGASSRRSSRSPRRPTSAWRCTRTIRRCRCRAAPSRSWTPSSTGRRTWTW